MTIMPVQQGMTKKKKKKKPNSRPKRNCVSQLDMSQEKNITDSKSFKRAVH